MPTSAFGRAFGPEECYIITIIIILSLFFFLPNSSLSFQQVRSSLLAPLLYFLYLLEKRYYLISNNSLLIVYELKNIFLNINKMVLFVIICIASVTNELRDLEQKRQKLQESITMASNRVDSLRQEESRLNTELQRLKMSVHQVCMFHY